MPCVIDLIQIEDWNGVRERRKSVERGNKENKVSILPSMGLGWFEQNALLPDLFKRMVSAKPDQSINGSLPLILIIMSK